MMESSASIAFVSPSRMWRARAPCAARIRSLAHHFAAKLDERLEHLLEVQNARLPLTIARLMTPNDDCIGVSL
jgi:hypothetical protein